MADTAKPWLVDDMLWTLVQPLLPVRARRAHHPGRRPLDDRLVLQGSCSSCAQGSGGSICHRTSGLAAG
jgi:transposase